MELILNFALYLLSLIHIGNISILLDKTKASQKVVKSPLFIVIHGIITIVASVYTAWFVMSIYKVLDGLDFFIFVYSSLALVIGLFLSKSAVFKTLLGIVVVGSILYIFSVPAVPLNTEAQVSIQMYTKSSSEDTSSVKLVFDDAICYMHYLEEDVPDGMKVPRAVFKCGNSLGRTYPDGDSSKDDFEMQLAQTDEESKLEVVSKITGKASVFYYYGLEDFPYEVTTSDDTYIFHLSDEFIFYKNR